MSVATIRDVLRAIAKPGLVVFVLTIITFWINANLAPILMYESKQGMDGSTVVVEMWNDYFGAASNAQIIIIPKHNLSIIHVYINQSEGLGIENQTNVFIESQNQTSYRVYNVPHFYRGDRITHNDYSLRLC